MPQLLRFLRRGADGADDGGAELAFFQRVQAFNRRAAGTRDLILERAGMLAGFQNHFCAAQNGLRRELRRDVARQASRHAAVAQRLDELINIGLNPLGAIITAFFCGNNTKTMSKN